MGKSRATRGHLNFRSPLTPEAIDGLKKHKYNCVSVSPLDKYVMAHFWNFALRFVPMWCAPNLLTILGLICMVIGTSVSVYQCPDLATPCNPPSWTWYICILGTFLYQTLDALDGKQARRTKSSSPLGELFDHGCDSVSVFVASVCTATCISIGPTPVCFMMLVGPMIPFASAHWEAYVTGTLRFGYVDVTEGQFSLMLIYYWATRVNMDTYLDTPFFETGITKYDALLAFLVGGMGLSFLQNVFHSFRHMLKTGNFAGAAPIVPYALFVGLTYAMAYLTPDRLFEAHPVLFVFTVGFACARITNELIVAHITNTLFRKAQLSLLPIALVVLNGQVQLIPGTVALVCCCAATASLLLAYAMGVSYQIAHVLGIKVFSIPPPPKEN